MNREKKIVANYCYWMVIIVFSTLFITCRGKSSSQSKTDFWEGEVKPGTYTITYTHPSAGGTNRTEITFTIYEDKFVDYKTKETILWGKRTTTTNVASGYLKKHEEIYDGERKVWYGIIAKTEPDGSGKVWAFENNISPSLEFSGGDCKTYQEYNTYRRGELGVLKRIDTEQ